MIGVGSATTNDADIDSILETPEVEAVLSEAGYPELERDEAETVVFRLDDGSTYRSTSIPTAVGMLVFSGFADGANAEALLLLDDEPTNEYRRRRNRRVSQPGPGTPAAWPNGTTAFLVGREGSVRFVREAHPSELARLAPIVGKRVGDIDALVDAVEGLFYVFEDESEETSSSDDDEQVWVTDLAAETVRDVRSVSTEPGPSIQDHNRDYCLYQFGACLWSLALPSGCSYCGTLCKASKIAGWAGYAACFVCLSHVCGIRWLWNLSGCYDAAKCIDHWNIV